MLNNIAALMGTSVAAVGDYESIATTTVGAGGQATITFSSIPNTYKHLQIRASVLTAVAGKLIVLTCNNDTTAGNYVSHIVGGQGSTTAAGAFTASQTYMRLYGRDIGTNTTRPTVLITDILDYTSTNKNKTTRTLSGLDENGSGEINFYSGLWLNSSTVVSSLELKTQDASNFSQYSSFALYGIK